MSTITTAELGIADVSRRTGSEAARLALLEAHRDEVRAQLEEVARHLEFIEHKIEIYRERTGCH